MRYLHRQGLSFLPTDLYVRSLGVSYDKELTDPLPKFVLGDVVITGPLGIRELAFLPPYVQIEVVPDGTSVPRVDPLVYALRERGLPASYKDKPPTAPVLPKKGETPQYRERLRRYELYLDAVKWAGRHAYQLEVGRGDTPYTLVTDPSEASRVINSLRGKPYAFDYETCPNKAHRIVGVALADEKDAWYIAGNGLRALPELRSLLKDNVGIAHSVIYEYKVTAANSLFSLMPTDQALHHCTRVMNWVLSNTPGGNKLKPLVRERLGRDAIEFEDVVPQGADICDVPLESLAKYAAAGDGRNTYDLYLQLRRELEKEGLWHIYNTIERPLIPVLAEMELAGIAIDRGELEAQTLRALKRKSALVKGLRNLGFDKEITPNNIAKWFYEDLGLPVLEKTKVDRGSIRNDVLLKVRHLHPAVDNYMALQAIEGLLSKFFLPTLSSGRDVIYFSLQQTSTRTGRLSCSNPNIQQWPNEMRKLVVNRGGLIWARDYSQIEPRIAAAASGDPKMLEDYRSGRDVYTSLGLDMGFGELLRKDPSTRSTVKGIFLGWMYSSGPKTMQEQALKQGIILSISDAIKYRRALEDARPVFLQWKQKVIREARERGASFSLFGRRRLIPALRYRDPDIREKAEREAFNMVIQGTAADIIKMAMPKVFRLLKQSRSSLQLQVHDELVGSVGDYLSYEELEQTMVSNPLGIPLATEGGIGSNWFIAKKGS